MESLVELVALLDISPFRWSSIGTCLLCGSIIGLERQLRGKPVGIRTSSMIVLGTYIFIVAGSSVQTENSDPSRIIGQVVTGIGFLGAGVMLSKEGIIMGVTSAATIWALAAIGVCVAVVGSAVAIKFSILVVLILAGMNVVETYFSALKRGVRSRLQAWRDGG